MKLSPLKLFLASLAISSFAVAGCAADTTSTDGEEAEDVEVSSDELSARATQFVGSYAWRAGDSGPFVELQQLSLKNSGLYSAKVDAQLVNPAVRCIAFPCTLPESGTWTVVKSGGQLKIKLNPFGTKPSRSYYASIQEQTRTLSLKRFGLTTNLFFEGSTCANVRCTANTTCEMSFKNGTYSPSCVPNAPVATCAATSCIVGTTCVDKPTGAECIANPPVTSCAAMLCAPGTTCVDNPVTGGKCVSSAPCVKTGCSGQICADGQRASTCEFRPEYACYQTATCKRQDNGACGFTQTPALAACLASAGNN
jgi:hypothetical protein